MHRKKKRLKKCIKGNILEIGVFSGSQVIPGVGEDKQVLPGVVGTAPAFPPVPFLLVPLRALRRNAGPDPHPFRGIRPPGRLEPEEPGKRFPGPRHYGRYLLFHHGPDALDGLRAGSQENHQRLQAGTGAHDPRAGGTGPAGHHPGTFRY